MAVFGNYFIANACGCYTKLICFVGEENQVFDEEPAYYLEGTYSTASVVKNEKSSTQLERQVESSSSNSLIDKLTERY